MRALVVSKPGSWSVTDVPEPKAGPNDIVVAPKAVGICGSDLHILAGEFPPTPYPIIPGHEFAGVVVEVGDEVEGVVVGERVAVDPSLFCGTCRFCQAGRGNLCDNWGAIGDTTSGAFAELVAVPHQNAYKIPESMSFSAGALVEPMSCVVHGIHRLSIRAGSDLLIVGGGTIGLMLLQTARRSGASRVDVVDIDDSRCARARDFGADGTANSVEDVIALRGQRYEYVIDASGVPEATAEALKGLDKGGTFLIFGVAPEDGRIALSPFAMYNNEYSILGSMAVLNSFEPALKMLAAKTVDVEAMVTHQYPLEEFDRALDTMKSREGLKIQIGMN